MSKNDVSNCASMAGYLDRIGAGKVLLDRGPLSFDWTPPLLVGRERERILNQHVERRYQKRFEEKEAS